MSEHAEQAHVARRETAADQTRRRTERETRGPRLVVTGLVVTYALVVTPIVAIYVAVKV